MIPLTEPPTPTHTALTVLDELVVELTTTPDSWHQGSAIGHTGANGVTRRQRCISQMLSDAAISHPGLCTWLHTVAHIEIIERAARRAGLDPWHLPEHMPEAQRAVIDATRAVNERRPVFGLPSWNDTPGRTVDDVAELLDACKYRIETSGH